MKIYFSGIGGVGIGPLAEIASDAGYEVVGSDLSSSLMTEQLESRGVTVYYGQDGESLKKEHAKQPVDLFVHTAALPSDHPELMLAKQLGIKTAKRDELISHIVSEKGLKLIAISGTHGKTTTTGLMVWATQQLNIPVSYLVGTTLSFGPSGRFDPNAEYFVYECDEFDRNFLKFTPHLSIVTALDYDHPDTYPTPADYREAFVQFLEQSAFSLIWQKDLHYLKQPDIPASYESYDDLMDLHELTLAGQHVRQNAFLVSRALGRLFDRSIDQPAIIEAINSFPGTNRRFEKLAENLYTDYGHHPKEIAATLQMASELSNEIVLVYQPHQNTRQHQIIDQYTDEVFEKAAEIYWVPTYLSREDPSLATLTPSDLSGKLTNKTNVHISELDNSLIQSIRNHVAAGQLVLVMGAGSIDGWARSIPS